MLIERNGFKFNGNWVPKEKIPKWSKWRNLRFFSSNFEKISLQTVILKNFRLFFSHLQGRTKIEYP